MNALRDRLRHWLQWPCLAAIALWAATDQILPGLGHLAQIVFILPALLLFLLGDHHRALRAPLVFLLAALLIQLTSWALAPEIPGFPPETTPRLDRLARWCLFLFAAFWMLGRPAWCGGLWLCGALGLLLAPWVTGGGLAELQAALAGERINFGLRNEQHTGLFAGAVLLGSFAGLIEPPRPGRWARLYRPGLLVLLVVSAGIVLATQTRGIWLGCFVGAALILLGYLGLWWRHRQHHPRRPWAPLALGLTLMALTLTASVQLMQNFGAERGQLEQLAELDMDTPAFDTMSIRLRSWYYALPWIAERPLVGWGSRGSTAVSQLSDALTPQLKAQYTHLHSSYFDLSVQYGLPAVALMLTMLAWLGLTAWRAWQARRLGDGKLLFVGGFIGFWLVANTFEAYMLYSSGRFLWNLVFAGVLACHPLAANSNRR